MINEEARLTEADCFNKEHDCYIHVEMKGGKNCEIVIGGGGLALAYGLTGVIERMSTLSETPFEGILKVINELHEIK